MSSLPGWQPQIGPPPPAGYSPAQPDSSFSPPKRLPVDRPMSGARRAGAVAALISCVFGAGLAGVVVGHRMASTRTSTPAPAASPVQPSLDVTRAQTIDLCTRFAAGYAALPSPQTSAADVVPAANYIADALRDNPIAEGSVRVGAMLVGARCGGGARTFVGCGVGLVAGGHAEGQANTRRGQQVLGVAVGWLSGRQCDAGRVGRTP
jgi:hypothetical protein